MKKLLFTAAIMGLLISTSCKKDDDGDSRNCKTCEMADAGNALTYCDNGDGTVTISSNGQSQTTNLEGISFNDYIAALQQIGFSCR